MYIFIRNNDPKKHQIPLEDPKRPKKTILKWTSKPFVLLKNLSFVALQPEFFQVAIYQNPWVAVKKRARGALIFYSFFTENTVFHSPISHFTLLTSFPLDFKGFCPLWPSFPLISRHLLRAFLSSFGWQSINPHQPKILGFYLHFP